MHTNGYRYTECGLDNVFIEGVDVVQDDHGETVCRIENVLGLHKTIAHAIIGRRGQAMSGPELRFLRSEMGLTQEEMAKILRRERVTVGRWERGENAIDSNAELVVRLLAAERLDINPDMTIEEMSRDTEWRAQVTEIRIDGSDPKHYRPIEEAA